MHANVLHSQVVVAKGESIFQNLVDVDRGALRLVLAREAQQVLHDTMGALRLFVQFIGVLDSLRTDLSARGEQLAVAENRRERIVQLVRYAGNQLPDGGHLFAMKQLLLRSAQIVVCLPSLFVQDTAIDGVRNLAADCDQQIDIGRRKFSR